MVGVTGAGERPPRVQLVSKPGAAATGLGRYALELERGLRAVGVEIRQAPLRDPVPPALAAAARRLGYDVATFTRSYPLRVDARPGYVTHLTSQTIATLLLTQRLPRPTVVTVHDILPYLLRDDPELSIYRRRLDRVTDGLAMRALRRADRLIAVSHYTKQTVVDALAIPADRIDVVHNGVDAERFRPLAVPKELRDRYGLPADRRYVLFVGSEDPRKNLAALLRAMAALRQGGVGATLLKVGAPAFLERRAHHLQLCEALGIADAVRWIDAVSEEDLPLLYNLADVFAFPSRYEGFGLPVLEALACGTPVVALRRSSVPELVGDVAGLVDGDDPITFAAALADALMDRDHGAAARVDQARRFTWAGAAEAVAAAYRRVAPTGDDGR